MRNWFALHNIIAENMRYCYIKAAESAWRGGMCASSNYGKIARYVRYCLFWHSFRQSEPTYHFDDKPFANKKIRNVGFAEETSIAIEWTFVSAGNVLFAEYGVLVDKSEDKASSRTQYPVRLGERHCGLRDKADGGDHQRQVESIGREWQRFGDSIEHLDAAGASQRRHGRRWFDAELDAEGLCEASCANANLQGVLKRW